MTPAVRGRLRPTVQQQLLLECAFGSCERANAAWRQVRTGVDLDRLDTGSHALIPLVYRRLEDELEGDPLRERIKGIYRKTWYANGLLLAAADEALAALAGEGIRPLALHGIALARCYYAEHAHRPLTHADVAVRPEDEVRACYALGSAGWVGRRPDGVPRSEPVVFRNARGQVLALHRTLPENLRRPGVPDGDAEVWGAARLSRAFGVPVSTLAPADELLCAIVAGPDSTLDPNVLWVADAATILSTAGADVDARMFLARAGSHRVAAHVGPALRLVASLGVDVPAGLLVPRTVSPRERLAYRLYAQREGLTGGLPRSLAQHLRETGASGTGALATVATVPRFLARRWGVRRGRDVLGLALAKARRRLASRFPQPV